MCIVSIDNAWSRCGYRVPRRKIAGIIYVRSLRMTPLTQKADRDLEMMKAIVGTNEYNHVLG
jgi:hypothetical protein